MAIGFVLPLECGSREIFLDLVVPGGLRPGFEAGRTWEGSRKAPNGTWNVVNVGFAVFPRLQIMSKPVLVKELQCLLGKQLLSPSPSKQCESTAPSLDSAGRGEQLVQRGNSQLLLCVSCILCHSKSSKEGIVPLCSSPEGFLGSKSCQEHLDNTKWDFGVSVQGRSWCG